MPITEDQVRIAVLKVLARVPGGFMKTEDLIPAAAAILNPTGIDNQILDKRSDTHFSQKVRNLVSHRENSTSLESQGWAIYDANREGWTITSAGRTHIGV